MKINERINALLDQMGLTATHIERIPEGRTNQTYIVHTGDSRNDRYIARLAGEGTNSFINRADEVYNLQLAAQLGVAPILHTHNQGDFLMEYIDSPVIHSEDELFSGNVALQVVDVLKKLHNSGIQLRNDYSMVADSTTSTVAKMSLKSSDSTAQPNLQESKDAPFSLQCFWAVLTLAVTLVFVFTGGVNGCKGVKLLVGFPVFILETIVIIGFWRMFLKNRHVEATESQ